MCCFTAFSKSNSRFASSGNPSVMDSTHLTLLTDLWFSMPLHCATTAHGIHACGAGKVTDRNIHIWNVTEISSCSPITVRSSSGLERERQERGSVHSATRPGCKTAVSNTRFTSGSAAAANRSSEGERAQRTAHGKFLWIGNWQNSVCAHAPLARIWSRGLT